MKSMTGYALIRKKTTNVQYEVSLRSVNGRFLEMRFHMPKELMHLESDFRKSMQASFRRGTVDIFIHRKTLSAKKFTLFFNSGLAEKYAEVFKKAARISKSTSALSAESLLRLPEVVTLENETAPDSKEDSTLKSLFNQAIKKCEVEREREGQALKNHLLSLIQKLEKECQQILHWRESANKEISAKYEARIKTRLEGREIDQSRLVQEIAILIEKSDINEEIQRLAEHVKNLKNLVQKKDCEGKKLDFYTQELLREVNTIGSKSQVANITTAVIEAKSMIEKLREQVQNIE